MSDIDLPEHIAERDCVSSHLGVWCIEDRVASQLEDVVANGDLETLIEQAQDIETPSLLDRTSRVGDTAIVPITGSLTKGSSSLGGTSTVETRQVLDTLAQDDQVEDIVLQIDSPGGHVAGVPDLANDVQRIADDPDLPGVTAFIEDMGASAAYWVASQADRVVAANRVTEVGSIGVRTVVHDRSEQFEEEGIEVISMATGERKDDFVKGQPVEDEAIQNYQNQLDAIHDVFVETVADGRGMTESEVADLATGETFLADRAVDNGLVDDIKSLRAVLEDLSSRRQETEPVVADEPLDVVPGVEAATNSARILDVSFVSESTEEVDMSAERLSSDGPLISTTRNPGMGQSMADDNEPNDGSPQLDALKEELASELKEDLASDIKEEVTSEVKDVVSDAVEQRDRQQQLQEHKRRVARQLGVGVEMFRHCDSVDAVDEFAADLADEVGRSSNAIEGVDLDPDASPETDYEQIVEQREEEREAWKDELLQMDVRDGTQSVSTVRRVGGD